MLRKLLSIYTVTSTTFILVVSIFLFGTAFYIFYIKPPSFIWSLQDKMETDSVLMGRIGGWKEYHFSYSDSVKQDNTFKAVMVGKCDSASVVFRGTYTDDKYVISDTVVQECK